MQYKNTTLIVHPRGGYGKILLWCLAYFSGQFDKHASLPSWMFHYPYRNIAQYPSNQGVIDFILDDSFSPERRGTIEYLQGQKEFLFGCTTAEFDHSVCESYVDDYKIFFKKIVYLTLDPSCHLLVLNNQLKKSITRSEQFFNKVIEQHAGSFDVNLPVPKWQLRKFLSFEHQSRFLYIKQWNQPAVGNNVINVPVRQLISDFQGTVTTLFQNLELPILYDDQFDRIKKEWLYFEDFTNIDSLCQHIVSAVLSDEEFKWSDTQLTLIDEAYVQYLLRQHGLELRCHGLDIFPSSSVQLKELLYSV